MKRFVLFLAISLIFINITQGQSDNQGTQSTEIQEMKERKEIIKKVDKKEKTRIEKLRASIGKDKEKLTGLMKKK